MSALYPVILAGGSGTRLWPLSRQLFPKQFHSLFGKDSFLQATLKRLHGIEREPAILLCNEEHRFLVAEQCRAIGVPWRHIILEPSPRSTAPAIGLAALAALAEDDDATLLVLPSDHTIKNVEEFQRVVGIAVDQVGDGLLTFGIVPTGPETGYGYIEAARHESEGLARVDRFVEKPSADVAEALFNSGDYSWNSGMFVFRAKAYLEELHKHRPEMFELVTESFADAAQDLEFLRPSLVFERCPTESIDYAVMENTERAVMIRADIGWSDVGSWSAVWECLPQDEAGNAVSGDVIHRDTANSLIVAEDRLVATIGLENAVVIETRDAVLVTNRDRVQDVKHVVDELKSCTRTEHETHVKVYRPWGTYETVETGRRYQVKRITVNPGASLSLQMHHHRSEHWVVVRGTAKVERNEESFILSENESTYIPLGSTHRLSNPGRMPVELIEIQVGTYLDEDDIVRLDDRYGRTPDSE